MLLAFLTLLGVIAIVAVVGFFMLRKGPEIIQGQAEVTEYRVSSKVPGRILEFRVKEGQSVNAGDTLAILEAPDVVAKMEQARAAEAAAQAQNEKAIKGAREEQIQAAYEMWQKAQAGVTIAEKSYKRVKNLYEQGVMPAQKLDEVTAQRDAAIATEKAAKAQYTMAKNGAEREDKMAAEALVNRAKGAVAEVESYIKETYLIAPAAGEVSEIFPKVGELVGTGAPIMNIAELNDTIGRVMPYWKCIIFPALMYKDSLLVVAHGNSLRGIIKHLKGISDTDISNLNLPTAVPYVFEFDDRLVLVKDYYLGNPEEIRKRAEAVAKQGMAKK